MGRPTIDEKGEPRKRAVFYVTEYEKRVLIDTLSEQRKPGMDPMKVYAALAPIADQVPMTDEQKVAAQSIRQAADLMRMEQAKKAGVGQPKKKGFCRGACERKTPCPPGDCKNA